MAAHDLTGDVMYIARYAARTGHAHAHCSAFAVQLNRLRCAVKVPAKGRQQQGA